MPSVAEKLVPPYLAVVVRPLDGAAAWKVLDALITEAPQVPGFLGLETGQLDDGTGGLVCYWSTADAVARWKARAMNGLTDDAPLAYRGLDSLCNLTMTRVAKRLFRRKTPLDVPFVPGAGLAMPAAHQAA